MRRLGRVVVLAMVVLACCETLAKDDATLRSQLDKYQFIIGLSPEAREKLHPVPFHTTVIVWDLEGAMRGEPMSAWQADNGTRVGIMERAGDEVEWFEIETHARTVSAPR